MRLFSTPGNKNREGFTIIELILFMAIFSILIVSLSDIFASILDTRTESEATSSVEQDGDSILARLMYDISRAESIVTPATLGGTSNTTLQIRVDGVDYIYNLSGGKLLLNGDQLNGYDTTVSNLTFRRLGNSLSGKNSVQITFTVTSIKQKKSGPEVRNYQTTVGIRDET